MTNNTPDYEDNLYFDTQNTKKDLCITVEKQVWESTLNRSMKLQAENAQLKELLKECEEKILLMDFDSIKIEILQKIDEVLK